MILAKEERIFFRGVKGIPLSIFRGFQFVCRCRMGFSDICEDCDFPVSFSRRCDELAGKVCSY